MKLDPQMPRRRILFLSYLYPSFNGSGTQIRAAALVRMLASRDDVFLLAANHYDRLPGPTDPELEAFCHKILYVRLVPGEATRQAWHPVEYLADWAKFPHLDCQTGHVAAAIQDFYQQNNLDKLFVFRMESFFLLEGSLDQFPGAWLDLDESTFRRNQQIEQLKSQARGIRLDPEQCRANAVIRVIENKVIPRFEKVFVSSEEEARDARRVRPQGGIEVMPNVFPDRTALTGSPADKPREILFVGTLSYYPNEDAVRYFCRDIFPLIRRVLGDSILFRIVGFGCPPGLREVGEEPGVSLMGFQEFLEPYYAQASLVVVPLRAGTGTRLKILESFVYGRPVVSTSIGAEGLDVTDGDNILLRDQPETFAQACLQLLDQPELAQRLVEGGRCLHRNRYSLDHLLRCYGQSLS
ncbi:MAG: glycosyltransferase family 4 protein [Candidatus Methylacidiphilales bacterium]|nr:glycosyltransferase family 4 protein [Candidatus Methylacidiphilales bacterium]